MSQSVVSELAPHGVLRAAINMGNFLLVTGKNPSGDPDGVSPDMARAIADRLGVPVKYVPFAKPGELADAVGSDAWDIGLIGAEPARAEKIANLSDCEIADYRDKQEFIEAIRADRFASEKEAADFSLTKARQLVDEQGERLFS